MAEMHETACVCVCVCVCGFGCVFVLVGRCVRVSVFVLVGRCVCAVVNNWSELLACNLCPPPRPPSFTPPNENTNKHTQNTTTKHTLGPMVTATASASLLTPARRASRPLRPKSSCFAMVRRACSMAAVRGTARYITVGKRCVCVCV